VRIALLTLTACGRIGFSAGEVGVPDDTAIPPDGLVEPGLVAWYRMEDDPSDGRLEDSAGVGQPALCAAGLTCGVATPGRIGQGVLLDGSVQFYRVASDASLVTPNELTIAFWARWDAIGYSYAVTKRYGTINNSWSVYVDDTPNTIFESVNEPGPSGVFDVIAPAPSLGTWTHYAISWDNSTKRGYVNGVKLLDTSSVDFAFDDGDVLFGADEDNGSVYGYWTGALDEIRIYDRKLSDFEVQALSQL
jgi:hypothetical protein